MSFFRPLIFFKINFFDSGILLVSNSLDPDQARYFVGPKLGPNSVCKGYQQMSIVGKDLVRINIVSKTIPQLVPKI